MQNTLRKGSIAVQEPDVRANRRNPAMPEPESAVIVNADDWGFDAFTTGRILECMHAGAVSSASAMVFMEDSERSAELAGAEGVDTGLHLNLTTEFTSSDCPRRLKEEQARVWRFLRSHTFARTLYHPGLARSFEYVVRTQMEEYERLFGAAPRRIDGHHHMHLCANVMWGNLLPEDIILRRNFSFRWGEKTRLNRAYRNWRDKKLAKRFRLADHFFSLWPVRPAERLEKIFALGARSNVEIETHPVKEEEYRFLMQELDGYGGKVSVMQGYVLRNFEKDGSAPGGGGSGA